jgi:hypothetical protein
VLARCPGQLQSTSQRRGRPATRRVGQIVGQRWSLPLCSSGSCGLYGTAAASSSQPCDFIFTRSPTEAIPASKTWLRGTSPLLLSVGSDFPLKRGHLRSDCRSNNLRAASCLAITDPEKDLRSALIIPSTAKVWPSATLASGDGRRPLGQHSVCLVLHVLQVGFSVVFLS